MHAYYPSQGHILTTPSRGGGGSGSLGLPTSLTDRMLRLPINAVDYSATTSNVRQNGTWSVWPAKAVGKAAPIGLVLSPRSYMSRSTLLIPPQPGSATTSPRVLGWNMVLWIMLSIRLWSGKVNFQNHCCNYSTTVSYNLRVNEAEVLRLYFNVGVDDVQPPLRIRTEHFLVPLRIVHAYVLNPCLPTFRAHCPRHIHAGGMWADVQICVKQGVPLVSLVPWKWRDGPSAY